jgi:hypothetical protein
MKFVHTRSACDMTPTTQNFPFGQPFVRVEQTERSAKKVFVLGVYASAVHARWIGPDNKTIITALAVASEPYIFWRGDGVDEIISRIEVPTGLGRLARAADRLNGPSGVALDELILVPLGVRREDVWLCDLVPHSCTNPSQHAAIERAYAPVVGKHGVTAATVPCVPERLTDEARRQDIVAELRDSKGSVISRLNGS